MTYEQDVLEIIEEAEIFAEDPFRYTGTIPKSRVNAKRGAFVVADTNSIVGFVVVNMEEIEEYDPFKVIGHIPSKQVPSIFHITLQEETGAQITFVLEEDTLLDALICVFEHELYSPDAVLYSFSAHPIGSTVSLI